MTGNVYYLASDDVDLGALSGQRITAYGTTEEVVKSVVLIVTRVEPASEPDRTATLSFELTVSKGEPWRMLRSSDPYPPRDPAGSS